jgi:DNA-binding YbaB/EbfC family protein
VVARHRCPLSLSSASSLQRLHTITTGVAAGSTREVPVFDPSKLSEMMQQAQQMQSKMQADLKGQTVEGQAGGGMVRVTVNGVYEVTAVKIDPAVVDPKDCALLEDLVRAAVGQALARVEEARLDNARRMAGAMGIPGGLF